MGKPDTEVVDFSTKFEIIDEIIEVSDTIALSMEENGPAVILEKLIGGGFFGKIN